MFLLSMGFPLASGPLSGHAYYLRWGVVQISLANFVIILTMIALFVAALLLPFPHGRDEQGAGTLEIQDNDDVSA